MAKLQFATAAVLALLALSASLCVADQPAAEPTADEQTGRLSPETIEIIEDQLENLTRCVDKLIQGGDNACPPTIEDLSWKTVVRPSTNCCKNIIEMDGADPKCWGLILPEHNLITKVPELLRHCKTLVRPKPRKVLP